MAVVAKPEPRLSLYHLLSPEVLADPYPLYRRLRTEDPVLWDPFLHAWVVTRYDDVVQVLLDFSALRTPTPEQLTDMGLPDLSPIAQVMVKQMLFMDPPAHTRLRGLCSQAFTPRRVEALREHIQDIANRFWIPCFRSVKWMWLPTLPLPCPRLSLRRCWECRFPIMSS